MTASSEFGDPGELAAALAATRAECRELREQLAEASESLVRWRAAALAGWNARGLSAESGQVQREIESMRNSLSWRVTKPLRVVRILVPTRHG
jgi:hypothetical protein